MELRRCANSKCGELGKSKCASCRLVSYCSVQCQKGHWQQHKGSCKKSKSDENSFPAKSPNERLQILKAQIQAAFQQKIFQDAIKISCDAILVANEIPQQPELCVELVELYLNLSIAHLQMNQAREADQVSKLCVEEADRAVALRESHPQAIDMLLLALNNRAFILMNIQRLDLAEQAATRANGLAEKLFPKLDIRLLKVLRINGLIKSKLNKIDQAERFLRSAFFVSNKCNGPCHQDTQQSLEELLHLLWNKDDMVTAETLAKENFDMVVEAGGGDGEFMVAEAAAIYSSALAKAGKAAEAEPFMRRALAIKEKLFGPDCPQV